MKDEVDSGSDMEIQKKSKISRKRRLHQVDDDSEEIDNKQFGAFTDQSPAKKGI